MSTYQAVSGAGMGAILETQRELKEVLNDGVNPRDVKAEILPCGGDKKHYPIAFNALAQIDVFTENDYTYEEMKMTNETKKIMEDDSIAVSATYCAYSSLVSSLQSRSTLKQKKWHQLMK